MAATQAPHSRSVKIDGTIYFLPTKVADHIAMLDAKKAAKKKAKGGKLDSLYRRFIDPKPSKSVSLDSLFRQSLGRGRR